LVAAVNIDTDQIREEKGDENFIPATNYFYISTNNREGRDSSRADSLQFLDASVVTTAGWLWSDLNELNQRMAAEGSLASFWSIATPSLTTSISVGYVMWLIKGGQIMAGLMAQVPAWRLISIDPLPIIRSMEEEDLDVEGDSLASMVDEASNDVRDPLTDDGHDVGVAPITQGSW
jgi:hypothetical protein